MGNDTMSNCTPSINGKAVSKFIRYFNRPWDDLVGVRMIGKDASSSALKASLSSQYFSYFNNGVIDDAFSAEIGENALFKAEDWDGLMKNPHWKRPKRRSPLKLHLVTMRPKKLKILYLGLQLLCQLRN
jgi:hypothetical protein